MSYVSVYENIGSGTSPDNNGLMNATQLPPRPSPSGFFSQTSNSAIPAQQMTTQLPIVVNDSRFGLPPGIYKQIGVDPSGRILYQKIGDVNQSDMDYASNRNITQNALDVIMNYTPFSSVPFYNSDLILVIGFGISLLDNIENLIDLFQDRIPNITSLRALNTYGSSKPTSSAAVSSSKLNFNSGVVNSGTYGSPNQVSAGPVNLTNTNPTTTPVTGFSGNLGTGIGGGTPGNTTTPNLPTINNVQFSVPSGETQTTSFPGLGDQSVITAGIPSTSSITGSILQPNPNNANSDSTNAVNNPFANLSGGQVNVPGKGIGVPSYPVGLTAQSLGANVQTTVENQLSNILEQSGFSVGDFNIAEEGLASNIPNITSIPGGLPTSITSPVNNNLPTGISVTNTNNSTTQTSSANVTIPANLQSVVGASSSPFSSVAPTQVTDPSNTITTTGTPISTLNNYPNGINSITGQIDNTVPAPTTSANKPIFNLPAGQSLTPSDYVTLTGQLPPPGFDLDTLFDLITNTAMTADELTNIGAALLFDSNRNSTTSFGTSTDGSSDSGYFTNNSTQVGSSYPTTTNAGVFSTTTNSGTITYGGGYGGSSSSASTSTNSGSFTNTTPTNFTQTSSSANLQQVTQTIQQSLSGSGSQLPAPTLTQLQQMFNGVFNQSDGEKLLRMDVVQSENCVAETIKVPITQGQMDGLSSFANDIGCDAFKNSAVAQAMNAGNILLAQAEMECWVSTAKGEDRSDRRASEIARMNDAPRTGLDQPLPEPIRNQEGICINYAFTANFEQRKNKGYVPWSPSQTNNNSGVTIATGVDLPGVGAGTINKLNIDNSLKTKLLPYTPATYRKQAAVDFLNQYPLTLSDDEVNSLDGEIKRTQLAGIIQRYNKDSKVPFNQLPCQAQTVIFDYCYQYGAGGAASRQPLWGYLTTQNWKLASNQLTMEASSGPTWMRSRQSARATYLNQLSAGVAV